VAQPLKDQYGPEVPLRVAAMLRAADPRFDADGFAAAALHGYHEQPLLGRARLVAAALVPYLPADPAAAVALIERSLPPLAQTERWRGVETFVLLPFGFAVAGIGLDCFEASMSALEQLTQRCTAEFSIRPFLEHRYAPTMARLAEWTAHPSDHVRRLVSEGTRPRLPWAPRLARFVQDPTPAVPLLAALLDDPSPYVRRSVANHLNDIAKDHPGLAVDLAARWASPAREPLLRHGLRSLLKAGDPGALAVLGHHRPAPLRAAVVVAPEPVLIGTSAQVTVSLHNPTGAAVQVLVDVVVGFVKADGRTSRKVFRGGVVDIPAGATATLRRRVSLRQHTTRTPYPGIHPVQVQVNGQALAQGSFTVAPPDQPPDQPAVEPSP
jgi:3-methyladenine DNA glycosylase AlkC